MHKRKGFTLIELLIVVSLISILAVISLVSYTRVRQRAKLSKVSTELTDISVALNQYAQDNAFQYPADTERSVPPGLEKYLAGGEWPVSAWDHGVFDWDNWTNQSGAQVYQITYRLCGLNDPVEYCRDAVLFPNFTRNSGIYYCVQGECVPHRDEPTAPGYCVNCKKKEVNY